MRVEKRTGAGDPVDGVVVAEKPVSLEKGQGLNLKITRARRGPGLRLGNRAGDVGDAEGRRRRDLAQHQGRRRLRRDHAGRLHARGGGLKPFSPCGRRIPKFRRDLRLNPR
ncbi:hypothetical protein ACRAWD_14010 [Caulobacter segnis]